MKKILLFLVVVFALSSCGDLVSTYQYDKTYPYKISRINQLDQSEFKGLCIYRVFSGVDNIKYIDNFNVVDSIGRFKIGDKVNFKLVISE